MNNTGKGIESAGKAYPDGLHDGARWHYHYDGNGNVTELTNASGATVATYRYTAFGDTWQSSGTAAQANHYRFSTKPIDDEVIRSASSAFNSGLYYYGYRFYNPGLGRWINRDPIGEQGGINLYAMVGNDAVNAWDYLGYRRNDDSDSGRRRRRRRDPFGGHGSSGRFVRHYYFGGGAAVDLADWGLLGRFKNAPDVKRSVNEYKDSVEADALRKCSDGDQTITATGNDTDVTDATGQIFSVGRSTFFRSFSCEVDCCNDSVKPTAAEPYTPSFTPDRTAGLGFRNVWFAR